MRELPKDVNTNTALSSPMSDMMGRVIVSMSEGKSEVHFTIGEQFLNLQDILHGGAYATMLDTACGVAIRGALDMEKYLGHVTLELKTCYLQAGYVGQYKAFGSVLRLGKSVAFVEAILHNDQDELVATASATFKLRARK